MNLRSIFRAAAVLLTSFLVGTAAHSQNVLHMYGPGGPAPAMTQAAAAFGEKAGIKMEVTTGPTPKWKDKALADADLIYSGSEYMMSDFAHTFEGLFDVHEAVPLYLRPSAILVRPGNPKKITGFKDLLKPGIKILVVAGAGQTGLWEDIAGRTGKIDDVRALRKNLRFPEAPNSGAAKQIWQDDASIDVWLIWNIWQVANPSLADVVAIEPEYTIWRDTGIVVTKHGKGNAHAAEFVHFLQSDAGKKIFASEGWRID
jgi:accessory colonization factor AcfC